MTLTPHSPGSAALLDRFFDLGGGERFRPFLAPDPEAVPRFWRDVEAVNAATADATLTFPELVEALDSGLRKLTAAEDAYAADMASWEAEKAELDALKTPDRKALDEHARRRPRKVRASSYLPAGFGGLDHFDREALAALILDGQVRLQDLRELPTAYVAASFAPGCPNVIDGAVCGEHVPGVFRQRRFCPSYGPTNWETAAPWPGFGFCSKACGTSFGHSRHRALSAFRAFAAEEAPYLARRLAEVEAERDTLRSELEFIERAATFAAPAPEADAFGPLPAFAATAEEARQ